MINSVKNLRCAEFSRVVLTFLLFGGIVNECLMKKQISDKVHFFGSE